MHALALDAGVADPAQPPARDRRARRRHATGRPAWPADLHRRSAHREGLRRRDHGRRSSGCTVHIADVAAFVTAGTRLDVDAEDRATSVYLPGRVDPMLPANLSDGACSLSPGDDRLRGHGHARTRPAPCRFERSADPKRPPPDLRAGRRGARRRQAPAELAAAVRRHLRQPSASRPTGGRAAHWRSIRRAGLPVRRRRGGGAEVESADGRPPADRGVDGAGQRTVAERLGGPRARPLPRARAARRRCAGVAGGAPGGAGRADPPLPPHPTGRRPGSTRGCSPLLLPASPPARGRGRAPSLVLRALERARYDPANLGHSGLASTAYCHFTSPIRRYPDLVCHRALLHRLGGARGGVAGDLAELAAHCSRREREAARWSGGATHLPRAAAPPSPLRPGLAGDVRRRGLGRHRRRAFVRFDELFEGLLPARSLGDDWYALDRLGVALVGSRTGSRVRLADPLTVRVRSADPATGKVLLDLGRV